jgi:hypothetical protein
MRIGFDLDGVVCNTSIPLWILTKDHSPQTLMLFIAGLKPNFNPALFAHVNDEVIFVTGRRPDTEELTRKWVKHWFPGIKVYFAPSPDWRTPDEWDDWFKKCAEHKAKVLKRLGVEVYFEDQPYTVEWLRKLAPEITTIQYGGKVDDTYKC